MPEFAPGEAKTAVAPITVKPSGLSCEAEIFLGPDEMTKVVTSGRVAFTSTGVEQDVSLPVTMPATEGTFHVYADVYAEGILLAAYQALEDVVIAPVEVPPFTFSNESVYRKTCPTATAWDTPVYDCTISNPHDRPVSHDLTLYMQSYSHTKYKWYDPRPATSHPGGRVSLTLKPGQSYDFHFDGYHWWPEYGEWGCDPGIPLHYTIVFWLQDEAGNRSEGVSVYRP